MTFWTIYAILVVQSLERLANPISSDLIPKVKVSASGDGRGNSEGTVSWSKDGESYQEANK